MIGLLTALGLTVFSAEGANWRTFDLSGTFDDAAGDATDKVLDTDPDGHLLFKGYARGSGLTSYSIALGEPVQDNSGELILLAGFTVPGATAANFSLVGEHIVDLGPFMPRPGNIKLPRKGWFSHAYTGPRKMVVGDFYYVAKSGQHIILQPVAFKVSNVQVNDTMPGTFGYTIHSADCALKVRFISASTLAGLQQVVKALATAKSTP